MCLFQGPQGPPGGLGNPGPIGEKVQDKELWSRIFRQPWWGMMKVNTFQTVPRTKVNAAVPHRESLVSPDHLGLEESLERRWGAQVLTLITLGGELVLYWAVCSSHWLTDPVDRVLEESVERKERLDNLELLDLLEDEADLEMMDPRETLYDTNKATYTPTHNIGIELNEVRLSPWIQIAFSVCLWLQGPVGFPGDPGPPGEVGPRVSFL